MHFNDNKYNPENIPNFLKTDFNVLLSMEEKEPVFMLDIAGLYKKNILPRLRQTVQKINFEACRILIFAAVSEGVSLVSLVCLRTQYVIVVIYVCLLY